jgi:hypothetical protein
MPLASSEAYEFNFIGYFIDISADLWDSKACLKSSKAFSVMDSNFPTESIRTSVVAVFTDSTRITFPVRNGLEAYGARMIRFNAHLY